MTRLAHNLIGIGLWLCSDDRAWPRSFRVTGAWAVGVCNAHVRKAMEQQEMAKRHAKPSSRKRHL